MNNKIRDLILMSLLSVPEYAIYYTEDQLVNECLMYMYLYMMTGNNLPKQEEMLNKFNEQYEKLNNKQQEIVKNEYFNIIETQDKNKGKVKKKGMINYE